MRRRLLTLGLVCTSLVAGACSGTTSDAAGAGAAGGVGGADACPEKAACIVDNSCIHNFDRCSDWSCADAFLCEPVVFSQQICASYVLNDPDTVMNPQAATCALKALRDGAKGWISWGGTCKNAPGIVTGKRDLHVRSGRIGLFASDDCGDLGCVHSKQGPMKLWDAGYFSNCINKTAQDVWSCLEGWSDGCLKK